MHGPVCSSIDKRDTGTRVMHASVCTIGGRVAASGAGEGGILGPALPSTPRARCAPQAGVWLHATVHAHCALNTLAGRQRWVSV